MLLSTHEAFNYSLAALKLTGTQLLVLLGPLILLSIIMHFVSRGVEKNSIELLGRRTYLILFGCIGISVHEIGHAIFAVIFGHRINKIRLFTINTEDGTMGYVDHSFNPKNIYHQIGNFFIGIGPILLGSFLLFLISLLVFDINIFKFNLLTFNELDFASLNSIKISFISVWESLVNYLISIWSAEKSTCWKVTLLAYALFSIGSSMTLSKSDVLSAWKGFLIIILLFFIFNLSTLWIGNFTESLINKTGTVVLAFCFIMLLSAFINLFFLILILIVRSIKNNAQMIFF